MLHGSILPKLIESHSLLGHLGEAAVGCQDLDEAGTSESLHLLLEPFRLKKRNQSPRMELHNDSTAHAKDVMLVALRHARLEWHLPVTVSLDVSETAYHWTSNKARA